MKDLKLNNKKGLLALEYLVGIILSVIGLFFIINTLSNFFLDDPTNLDIARGNAQSIVEFVDYSNEQNYKKYDCFYYQKLERLENFQVYTEKNKENYFYILDDSNVYIVPFSEYNLFLKQKNINSVKVADKFSFGNKINLREDITNQGDSKIDIDFEVFTLATIGGFSSSSINLARNEYIVLVPYLSKIEAFDLSLDTVYQRFTSWFNEYQNQNVLIGKVFSGDELKSLPSFALSINNKDELFIPSGQYSELLVKKNLCSFYGLRDKDEYLYYNPKNADGTANVKLRNERLLNLLNKKVVYNIPDMPSGVLNNFVWYSKNNFSCYINDSKKQCPNHFNNVQDIISFQEQIWKYFSLKNNIGKVDIVPKPEELKFDEIVNLEEVPLDFNSYFEILTEDISQLSNKKKEENMVYDITSINNDKINGVEESYSNLIQFRDGKIYSFYKTENNKNYYYSFKPSITNSGLRKRNESKEILIYFNNNIIKSSEVEEYDADKIGTGKGFLNKVMNAFGGDNEKIYLINLPFLNRDSKNKEYYQVFLTGSQYASIREFRK